MRPLGQHRNTCVHVNHPIITQYCFHGDVIVLQLNSCDLCLQCRIHDRPLLWAAVPNKLEMVRKFLMSYYRPQCSCGKVLFSQASVTLSTGG